MRFFLLFVALLALLDGSQACVPSKGAITLLTNETWEAGKDYTKLVTQLRGESYLFKLAFKRLDLHPKVARFEAKNEGGKVAVTATFSDIPACWRFADGFMKDVGRWGPANQPKPTYRIEKQCSYDFVGYLTLRSSVIYDDRISLEEHMKDLEKIPAFTEALEKVERGSGTVFGFVNSPTVDINFKFYDTETCETFLSALAVVFNDTISGTASGREKGIRCNNRA